MADAPLHDTPSDAPEHLKFLADRIVANVPASTVIGKHVALRRQGNEWRGKSPFLDELQSDFFVNDKEGWWVCLATKRRGDVVRFVMEAQGKSFTEAVTGLAAFLGVRAPL